MSEVPVRVAVVSRSRVVRAGIVALVGELRQDVVVVDATAPADSPHDVDVAIVDFDSAEQSGALHDLQHLFRAKVPVVGLVYQPKGVGRGRESDGALITLAVTAEELWDTITRATGSRTGLSAHFPADLSRRELDILRLVGNGADNHQIAAALSVSLNTVKTYIRSAYRKLGVTTRAGAVLWAVEHGLVGQPQGDRSAARRQA